MPQQNEICMKIDESPVDITGRTIETSLNQLKVGESALDESCRLQTRAKVASILRLV